MADSFCTFLDFRSLPTKYNFNLFLSPKHYYPHSHNSRIKRVKRRTFHLTLLSKPSSPTPSSSSSNFDVISTHEHRDGSILFRFGDPSEVPKIVKIEESDSLKEETESEEKTGCETVLDNDDEKEEMLEIADREVAASVSNEVTDHTNSEVVPSDSIAVFEGESDSLKKLSEGSNDVEVPVLISSEEIEVSSTPGVDIEHTGNVEEGINKECDDSSSANTSILLDKSSEMENNIITAELSEEGTVDTSTPGIDIEQNGNTEESLNKEQVNSIPSDSSVLESISETENYVTGEKFLEPEATDVTISDSLMPHPVITVPENDILQASEDSSSSDASVLENNSEIKDKVSEEEILETEATDVTMPDSLLPDPVISVPDNDNFQASADSSPSDASVLESNSAIENIITTEELLETEAADVTISDPSSADPVISVPDNDFVQASEDSSTLDATALENNSETGNIITTEELLETEAADITVLDPSLPDPVISVPDNDFVQASADSSPSDASALENNSEIENIITTEELSETEAADVTPLDPSLADPVITVSDNDTFQASADSSPSDASLLENISEIENIITTAELLETEAADVTPLDPSSADPVIVVSDNDTFQASADSSPSDASLLENISELENIITAAELLETEVADITILDPLPDPVISVPDNDSAQATLDNIATTDESTVSHQSVESEMQNEIIEDDGRESSESQLVSPLHQSEPATILSEEIGENILQAGMEDLVIEQASETEMNDIKAIIVQDAIIGNDNESNLNLTEVAESVLDEETDTKAVEESEEDDVSESLPVDLFLGSETDEVDSNAQSGDGVEASVHEVTEPISTDSTTTSQEIILPDFVLSSGAALLPHPSKVLTGGEDAYFIAGQTWLGVADGVGQWSFQGTKPGVYAQELMRNCERRISNSNGDSVNSPLELLKQSVAETDSVGSSTVLIAHFDGQALHVANVGDSGFIVLRHGAIYKRCSPMHHVFHFPRRIERGDDPSCLAELYRVDLEEDDVIISATDGLFDNLYDQEILLLVKKLLAADKKPQEIAELLATEAQERGGSPTGRSPFGDEAQAAGFVGYTGGKIDDIALIVSVVKRSGAIINS